MFADRLKSLRLSHNYSQVQLSHKLNVSKQTISNWENGNILPSIEMLINISRYFSVSCDYLLGLDERKYIDVSVLSEKQVMHIVQIINDICNFQTYSNLSFSTLAA